MLGLSTTASYTAVLHDGHWLPGPILFASGTYHVDVRVPGDHAVVLRGAKVTLPVDSREVVVTTVDNVIVSLRSKDKSEARKRFAPAHAALKTR